MFLTISATFEDIWHKLDIWDDYIPKEILFPVFNKNDTDTYRKIKNLQRLDIN